MHYKGFFLLLIYMKEKIFQRNEKKCVISVNSYHFKNHIYLSDIVIVVMLNVAAEVFVHFLA